MGSMTKPSPSPDLGRTTRNPAFSWQVVSALVLVVLAIGVAVTLGLTAVSATVGVVVGVACAWARLHGAPWLKTVVGAYVELFPRARLGLVLPLGLFLEFVRIPASLLIGFWIVLQLLFTYVGPAFGTVVWWTHIAGFAIGIALAWMSRGAIARRLRN